MFSTVLVIADGGLSWTPETFYAAATVVHILLILLAFRVLALSPDYNTFGGAVLVALGLNLAAYFTKDFGIVGVLTPSVVLFGLLAFIARGDVLKGGLVWLVVMASYLGLSHLIIPNSEDLFIEDLGGIPQTLDAGGLTPEAITEDDFENLTGSGRGSAR